jgi:polysaccharide export outer membrane protein
MQKYLYIFTAIFLLDSCKYYKQDILLKADGSIQGEAVQARLSEANKNYVTAPGDWIAFKVYTNEGELLIDPNMELAKELGGGANVAGTGNMGMMNPMLMGGIGGIGGGMLPGSLQHLIKADGFSDLPMIGRVKMAGYTYRQLDSVLAKEYGKFYEGAYVLSRIMNRRVIMLSNGADGNLYSQVLILTNENTSLLELLAMSGGIGKFARADRIRIIRGDLKNPEVLIIDLSTVEGMKAANLTIYPNDIVYVEPGRRNFFEFMKDATVATSLLSITTTIIALVAILRR